MSLSAYDLWDLPQNWVWASFAEVARVASNLASPLDYPDLPHIAPNHIESETGKLLPFSTAAADGVKSPKHLFTEGSILYSKIRPYLAKATLVKFGGLCSADMYPVTTGMDSDYLVNWLRSPAFTEFATRHQGRSVLPKINKKALAGLPVPVPPLQEQKRIAFVLEEHLSRLGAVDKVLRDSALRIDRYLQVSLQHMTSNYRSVRLRDVLANGLTNGRSVPTRMGGFPVLRLTALSGPYVDTSQRKDGDWEASEAHPFLVAPGDFLISRGNGSVSLVGRGSLALQIDAPIAYPDTIVRARPNSEKVDPEYLRIIWSSLHVRRQIESQARTTAGIHKVNQKILGAVEFPLPDLLTQKKICAEWSELEQGGGRLGRTVAISERRSKNLRRSLLAEAFAGRLVRQDPADEPGDALLARLRAEREAADVSKGRRHQTSGTPKSKSPPVSDELPVAARTPAPVSATQPIFDLEFPA
ncbi:restriction endonuclease subunit S [Streptomyces parvus]|uniref:restriction endonuclease subunit S n=1 Tax=Streptomyces parvus TaxID=66428 RepID=UPI0033E4E2EC